MTVVLSEPPGFSLALEEDQDVSLSDGSLDVADDGPGLLVQELHLDLGTLALGAGTAQNLEDASLLGAGLLVHPECLVLCLLSASSKGGNKISLCRFCVAESIDAGWTSKTLGHSVFSGQGGAEQSWLRQQSNPQSAFSGVRKR